MRIRFFRLTKHSTFDYKPLYYNPDKEELQQRVNKAKRQSGQSTEPYVPHIKGQFRPSLRRETNKKVERQANIRLIAIFVVLLAASYWFFGDIFRGIAEAMLQ